MTLGGVRGRVLLWLLFTLVLPLWGAAYLARLYVIDHVERAALERVNAARAADENRERVSDDVARRSLATLCDRDVAVDRAILSLSQGHTEREAAVDLDAELPILARSFDFEIVSVFVLGAPDSGMSRSLAHTGPRPRRLRSLIESAQHAGENGFIERVSNVDYRMRSCVVSRAAARLYVIAGSRMEASTHGQAERSPDESAARALDSHLTRLLWAAGAVAFLYAIFVTWVISRTMESPLRALEEAAKRVAAGDLDSSIRSTFGGKADRTMGAFNRMTHELNRTQQRLLRAERIAAWRDIARRIAHEIKNPLLPIQMSIETMQKTYATKHPDFDEIFNESTSAILEEVDRLKLIVTEFSRFARMPKPHAEELDVRELIQHVAAMHSASAVRVTHILPTTLRRVKADRDQLVQVLVNLVQNGIDAASAQHAGNPSEAHVELEVNDDATGDGVIILVRDNGAGIPKEVRAHIFDPYFTTKSHGTGLGLAIVHRIVSDHGGTIDIADTKGAGTEFRVQLFQEGPPIEADASQVS